MQSESPAPLVTQVARPALTTPRRFQSLLALDDIEALARRRLPRMIYGFVAGGAETNAGISAARQGYADLSLVPRTLRDVSARTTQTELFGKTYAAPFGVAPMGGAAMVAYRGDLALSGGAKAMNLPMILSATSLVPLEEVRRDNPDAWFQAYLAGEEARIFPMVDRVAAAGFGTLVVTADVPMLGNRENNTRNGFSMPLKVTPRVMLDSALAPRWLLGVIAQTFLRHGMPHFENMEAARGPAMLAQNAMRNFNRRDELTWRHIEAIRRRWKGNLVVKGLLSAEDAARARDAGCDGIIVSNHGGRQLDCAIAPIRVLPEMVAAAGAMPVMIDGGVRRGTDVLKALALGAKFVFLGRPFLYAAFIGGAPGVAHAMAVLAEELDRDMALLGVRAISELTPAMVRAPAG